MSTAQSELYDPPNRRGGVDLPEAGSASIAAHRVHNRDALIAPFSAPSWPLAALDDTNRPSRTIHFAEWPVGFQSFARHVAYVLINHGNPEALIEKRNSTVVRWPSAASIANILHRLRAHAIWLTKEWSEGHNETPVRTPVDVDPIHLDDLRAWIEVRYVDARVQGANLADVIRVWHLNPWLPDDCQWPDATWRRHNWSPKRRGGDNKTLVLSEPTFGPLLEWAIAFVTSFAPDILSAHKHYLDRLATESIAGVNATAATYLDQYALSNVPLPPRPGGKSSQGNGIGWHVLEYRHALPSKAFSSAFRGERKESLRISHEMAHTAMDIPVVGKFQGRQWIDYIGVYDVTYAGAGRNPSHGGPLIGHLRTACLIVVAALTGMRPDEILNLQYGCAPEPITRLGGSRLQLIRGNVFKGSARLEDGSPGQPRPAVWATVPSAAAAIRAAEQISDVLGRGSGLLFTEAGSVTVHTGTATGWIESFTDFVNHRLAPLTTAPSAFTIPPDPDGAITLKRFRRTLAWFLRHRPNGDVTTAVQYQHVGVAMGAGYAGTKESGMPDLLLEEDWNHRLATIRHLGTLLAEGEGIGGPAAARAIEATRKLPRHLLPADERRLRRDKSFPVYDNPAAVALCIYDERSALCQKLKQTEKDVRPDLLACVNGCANIARTDDHLEELYRRSSSMRAQAKLVPLPMAQSMLAEAELNERIVEECTATRRTIREEQFILAPPGELHPGS